jgi:hypothetical protein
MTKDYLELAVYNLDGNELLQGAEPNAPSKGIPSLLLKQRHPELVKALKAF